MITGYEGEPEAVEAKRAAVTAVLTGLGGDRAGRGARASRGSHGRFHAPYLRDSMLDVGVLVETLETATFWSNVDRLYADVKAALEPALGRPDDGALPHLARLRDRLLALLHGRRPRRPTTRSRSGWRPRPPRSDAMIAAGATITHHHAVGTDHKPWLAAGDRPGRRLDPARGQGRPRPDRHPQPGGADPVTASTAAPSRSWSTRPPAAAPRPTRSCRSPGCCARPAPPST